MTANVPARGPCFGATLPRMTELETLMKLAEGREAEVYAWPDESVLRLLRPGGRELAQLEQEARAMAAARAAGVRCPEPRGVVEVDGRPGLVLERLQGPDGLDDIASRPWRLRGAARAFGEQHALLGSVAAPEGLPSAAALVRRGIERADVPEEIRRRALDDLDGLPEGDRICHGDFHPGNLIWTDEGPTVIDWANASYGDATADHARTLLLLRTASLPPGMPLVLRALAKVARGVVVRGYIGAYTAVRPVDASTLARWELPVAIARLSEDIEEDRPALERHINALLRR